MKTILMSLFLLAAQGHLLEIDWLYNVSMFFLGTFGMIYLMKKVFQ